MSAVNCTPVDRTHSVAVGAEIPGRRFVLGLNYYASGFASWGATLAEVLYELPSRASDDTILHQQDSLGVWVAMLRQCAVGCASGSDLRVHEGGGEEPMILSRQ